MPDMSAMETDSERLERRLTDIETRLAFQEQALSEMSDALAQARVEATQSAQLLQNVVSELRTVRGLLYADPGSETPPPHY